jgi:hypothetical protein
MFVWPPPPILKGEDNGIFYRDTVFFGMAHSHIHLYKLSGIWTIDSWGYYVSYRDNPRCGCLVGNVLDV